MQLAIVGLLGSLLGAVDGFTLGPSPCSQGSWRTRRTSIVTTRASIPVNQPHPDDDHYHHVLNQARECAINYDDDSSLCDPNDFLWQIFELESACVAGNLVGEEDDLCAVEPVADIVASLRERALQKAA